MERAREAIPRACPLCGGGAFVSFRFGLLGCAGCGLVVDPTVFRPGAAEELNRAHFGEAFEPDRSFWVRWFESWKNRRYLAGLRRAGVRAGRLLEVGVGSGSFLIAAQRAGFEVEGCDLSEPLCRRVRATTGVVVHNAALDRLPAAHYDVVAMHHVLEHVADPVGFLRAAAERLTPGGVLHIAVPNVDCWEARLRGWNSYEPYHMLYFQRRSLLRAIGAARLAPVAVWTVDPFSVWFITAVRSALGRPSGSTAFAAHDAGRRRAVEHAYRLLMMATGLLTFPLRWIQGKLGRGDELLVIARKAA